MSVVASSSHTKEKKSKSKHGREKRTKDKSSRSQPPPPTGDNAYPALSHAPPAGTILADYNVEFGEFDWDALKKDGEAELWLVRVPAGVRLCFPLLTAYFMHPRHGRLNQNI